MKRKFDCWTAMGAAFVLLALMAAATLPARGQLAAARSTPERAGHEVGISVLAETTIYAGAIVAVDSSGWALPADDATGLRVVGRAQSTVANAGANGAETVVVRRGVFRWDNGDTFTRADVGTLAYVEDDATVQKAASATYDIIAGVIVDVDSEGVWVDTYTIGSQGAVAVATLDTTGDATVGGDLAVTGDGTVGGTLGVTGASTTASHTSAGLVKGGTLGIGNGVFIRDGDALNWVEGGVTNAIVADVTN